MNIHCSTLVSDIRLQRWSHAWLQRHCQVMGRCGVLGTDSMIALAQASHHRGLSHVVHVGRANAEHSKIQNIA